MFEVPQPHQDMEQMVTNVETGFLAAIKNMDENEFERYKQRYPLLKPFLSTLWWKTKYEPDFEIDYDNVDEMMEQQFAYDRFMAVSLNTEAESNILNNYKNMKEIKADKSFVEIFNKLEKESKKIDLAATKLQTKSQSMWEKFNKKYKTRYKKARAFRFENGKFFAIIEEEGKGRE